MPSTSASRETIALSAALAWNFPASEAKKKTRLTRAMPLLRLKAPFINYSFVRTDRKYGGLLRSSFFCCLLFFSALNRDVRDRVPGVMNSYKHQQKRSCSDDEQRHGRMPLETATAASASAIRAITTNCKPVNAPADEPTMT